MARITRFRGKRNRRARAGELRPSSSALLWFLIFAAVIGVYYLQTGSDGSLFTLPKIGDPEAHTTFAMCGSFRKDDCVIDGDTFRYEGAAIRIMDGECWRAQRMSMRGVRRKEMWGFRDAIARSKLRTIFREKAPLGGQISD